MAESEVAMAVFPSAPAAVLPRENSVALGIRLRLIARWHNVARSSTQPSPWNS